MSAVLFFILMGLTMNDELKNSAVVVIVFFGGWIAGSVIMGGYLFSAHTIFGQHWNESFSSIRCKDWKCFLRFHLSSNGELTIYPIGVPRVGRRWQTAGRHMTPVPDDSLKPVLIEAPIKLH